MLFWRFFLALLWFTVSYPRKSAVCLRVYSCPFAVRFCDYSDFIICHLSFVMRFALAIDHALRPIRAALSLG